MPPGNVAGRVEKVTSLIIRPPKPKKKPKKPKKQVANASPDHHSRT